MNYSKWATEEELTKILEKYPTKEKIKYSGLPIIYKEDKLFYDNTEGHAIIIDNKNIATNSLIIPKLKLACLANENTLIETFNEDIIKESKNYYSEYGYKITILNLKDLESSQNFNPLKLIADLYQKQQYDEVYNLLNEIAYYIFKDHSTLDSYWNGTVADYFIGLVLYHLNNHNYLVNLNDVYSLSQKIDNEKLSPQSSHYKYLVATLNAPAETKGNIISIFNQKIRCLIDNDILVNKTSTQEYQMTDLLNKKNLVFIINVNYEYAKILSTIFLSEYFYCLSKTTTESTRKNIILENFDQSKPLRNVWQFLMDSRKLNINLLFTISDFKKLVYATSEEITSDIIGNCKNIVYLGSMDDKTTEEISKMCGLAYKETPLITATELKQIPINQAIILRYCTNPIKTNLISKSNIKWNI